MKKYYNLTDRTLLLFVFICMVELLTHSGCRPRRMSETEASAAFRRYVLDPIPKSVTNIKADQPSKIFGYTYTFRFNINRDDLGLLVNSRPFIKVWNVKYEDGMLSWGWGRVEVEGLVIPEGNPLDIPKYGISMPLYGDVLDLPREPAWFKPGLWDNPEAYGFHKVGNLVNIQALERDRQKSRGRVTTQVLLYNEKQGEAYFVVSSWEE